MVILYPELQKQLEICEKCDNHWLCYSHSRSVYNFDIVKRICPRPEVVEAMKKLQKLWNMERNPNRGT